MNPKQMLCGGRGKRQGRFATLVMGAVLVLAACQSQSPENLLQDAKSKLAKNELRPAVIQLKNALQQDESLQEARFLLGKTLLELGDPISAQIELTKASELGYPAEQIAPSAAVAMLALGQSDKLIERFALTELKEASAQAELKAALASAYAIKGDYTNSRRAIDAALSADARSRSAHLVDARWHMSQAQFGPARQAVETAIQMDPRYAAAWHLKGEVLQGSRADIAEVVQAYRQALSIDKKHIGSHVALISLHISRGDIDAAQAQLQALRSVHPTHLDTYYHEALLALSVSDTKLAAEKIQQVLKRVPNYSRALVLAGTIEFQRAAYAQAAAHLGKAISVGVELPNVRVMLAQAQMRGGDASRALMTLQPLLEKQPVLTEVLVAAAEAHQVLGKPAVAEALLARAAQGRKLVAAETAAESPSSVLASSLSGSDAQFALEIGLVEGAMRRREFDKAAQGIAQLQSKRPRAPEVALLRGRLDELRGDRQAARIAYGQAQQLAPKDYRAIAALAAMDAADKRPEAAIKRYEELLLIDPGNVQASLSLIQLLARQGLSKKDLLAKSDAVIARHPELAGPRLTKIALLLEQGEIKLALTAAQDGSVAHANDPAFQDMIGIAQLALGDANQAAAAFNRMAALQPGSPQPLMRMAELSVQQKDPRAALRHLQKALQLKPDYLPAQLNMVGLLLGTGKVRDAMQVARTVQQQRPTESVGWALEGDIARQTMQLAEAIHAYEQAMERRPSEEVVARLYMAYNEAQRRADAAKLEASWLAKSPASSRFLFMLGEQALQRSDYTQAQSYFQRVLELQPNNALALNNLAWLLNKAGKPDALSMAEKALALAPERAEILDTAAEIHASQKQWAKAIELQKRALAQQPEQAIYRLHLSQYLVAAGEKSQAREQLDILLARGQSMPQFAEAKRMRDAL